MCVLLVREIDSCNLQTSKRAKKKKKKKKGGEQRKCLCDLFFIRYECVREREREKERKRGKVELKQQQ